MNSFRKILTRFSQYLILCALAVLCVFPFWWTLVTAVSGSGNIFSRSEERRVGKEC